jgi:GNAT superfamily N-acetyltransferase
VTRIERVEPSEWQRCRDIRLRALREAPDAFGSTLAREEAFDSSDWAGRIEQGPSWFAVADGDDVGIISGGQHPGSDVPWVYATWVDPRVRGGGVAEALLGVVVAWARESGATLLGLDVTDRAPRAKRFYERYGFVTGERSFPMPRDPSITLIEMYLDLNDPRLAR